MKANTIAIYGIIIMGTAALILSLATLMLNALTAKDSTVTTSCLVVAAISGNAVSGLVGFISGAHMNSSAQPPLPPNPEKPTVG